MENFGNQPLIDARLRGTIGSTYRRLGRYERAEPQLVKALEIRKRVLGDDHPDTLSSMNSLAGLYNRQGRNDEAEPLFLQALESRKRVFGDDHPKTAETFYSLACFEAVRGDRAKAMDWLIQAVDAGFAGADWMPKDTDLESLHGPDFDALVESVRQSAAEQRGE